MALHKTIILNKGQNLLRIGNSHATQNINIAVIVPHNEVYDGYELFVILERPVTEGIYTFFSQYKTSSTLLLNNIRLPLNLDDASFILPQTKNNAIPDIDDVEKLIRLIWDRKISTWRIISVVASNSLS